MAVVKGLTGASILLIAVIYTMLFIFFNPVAVTFPWYYIFVGLFLIAGPFIRLFLYLSYNCLTMKLLIPCWNYFLYTASKQPLDGLSRPPEDSSDYLYSFYILLFSIIQIAGVYIVLNVTVFNLITNLRTWIFVLLTIAGTVVISVIFNLIGRWFVRRKDYAGYKKSNSYEWRYVRSNSKSHDATLRDVYEHAHGYGKLG
ncbi:MAG TPA: hypothetical protein VKY40_05520 [Halanaerobiales bacterium]|nr:hypothetical protein [Halanaerobiales bacterium]